jgi:hypothetical protein
MLTSSTYQDLLRHRDALQATLEAIPTYKQVQALNTLLELHEGKKDVCSSDRIPYNLTTVPGRKDVKSSPEERNHIVESAKKHQLANRNKPITIRDLLAALQKRGVDVRGKNPGTTLAAVLSRRPDFEMVDKDLRLWTLKSVVYEFATEQHICCQPGISDEPADYKIEANVPAAAFMGDAARHR